MLPRHKPKRPGQHFSFSSSLSRLSWTHRVLVAFTAAVVTVLFLLAAHAHVAPRQNSGEAVVRDTQKFPRKQLAAGNKVKFLESQHNLQHSKLIDVPVEDSNKIFKGQPDDSLAGNNALHLNKNEPGFLANVKSSDMQAAPTGKTGLPASKSNPLGFYFNKDLAVAAARKSVGGVPHLERPVGQNKAALGYYFNKDKSQSVDIQQADSANDQQSVDAALTDTAAEGKSSRQGKGLSSIIQTSVYLHQDRQQTRGKAGAASSEHDARQEAVKGRSSSASGLAVNLTAVEFKPLTISLNTDDV